MPRHEPCHRQHESGIRHNGMAPCLLPETLFPNQLMP